MTTGLTFGQRRIPLPQLDQLNLGQALMQQVQPFSGQIAANRNAANMMPMQQPQQPMAQPMAQGQGPSFQFQDLNRAFQLDPRNTLSNALLQQGMRGGPVRTPLEGIGRLSQSLVGAMLQRRALDRLEGQETTRQENLQTQYDAILGNLPQNVRSLLPTIATPEALQSVQQLGLQVASAPTSEFEFRNIDGNIVFGTKVTNPLTNTTTFNPSGSIKAPTQPKTNIITLVNKDDPNDVVTGDENSEKINAALESGKNYARQTSGTNINIDQQTQSKFDEKAAESAIKRLEDIQKLVFQDAELENRLDIAESLLLGGTETGPFTELTIGLRGSLKQLGLLNDEQVQNLTNQEVLRTSFNYLIPRQRVPGSGATSDFEARLFSQATANLQNTPEANLILVKGLQALTTRKKEVLKAMEKYATDNKNLLGVAEYVDENVSPAFKAYNTDNEFDSAVEKGELKKGDLYFNGKLGIFDFYEG